jgi:EAL domain-containing protein (putative c-di-GMP-specific phosphodiesterase class I)
MVRIPREVWNHPDRGIFSPGVLRKSAAACGYAGVCDRLPASALDRHSRAITLPKPCKVI